jgi:hypothetical protein
MFIISWTSFSKLTSLQSSHCKTWASYMRHDVLTSFIGQSPPWGADSCSTSQEIPNLMLALNLRWGQCLSVCVRRSFKLLNQLCIFLRSLMWILCHRMLSCNQ